MPALLLIALAGAIAQLVDGGLGMGFGITSTTIMLCAGLGPAQASGVVHVAEVGTTLASGLSHWKFGNVDWKVVALLGAPGAIAAFTGATLLSRLSLESAAPVTATILCLVGANLVWRFSRGRIAREIRIRAYSPWFLIGLGAVGGLVDSTGGGGWGPVTTSTLLSMGRQSPRRVVGTVNTAEFLVAMAASTGFVIGLWPQLHEHIFAVIALLIGGVITSPVAAWLISRLNPIALGGLVGTTIVAVNLPGPWWVALLAIVVGVGLTLRGWLRARAAQRNVSVVTKRAQAISV
ncbi:sulfite exporter TauE/SafE family protein [Corynebacterium rouxii]|uniref:sulfite exporter TauE/SafE family protein n=1 Tax=Corynebacterium rouxii TaxID=2719119 RepID=UPI00313F33C0